MCLSSLARACIIYVSCNGVQRELAGSMLEF